MTRWNPRTSGFWPARSAMASKTINPPLTEEHAGHGACDQESAR